jgi:hypothetical protein
MTQYDSKTITDELWTNAQINSIKNPNINSILTNTGHGIYNVASDGSSYSDLRMSHTREFWGHTHPLTVQNKYSQLTKLIDDTSNYSVITKEDLNIKLQGYKKFNFSDLKFKNIIAESNVLVELNENDFLQHGTEYISRSLSDLAQNKSLWIHHKDTTLYTENNFFFSNSNTLFVGESYEILSIADVYLTNSGQGSKQNSQFYNSFINFVDNILYKDNLGKFIFNQSTIDTFIQNQSVELTRIKNYIRVKQESRIDINKFKENGIIIDENNFIDSTLYLSIPVSCTKNELLDTLQRVVLSLKD